MPLKCKSLDKYNHLILVFYFTFFLSKIVRWVTASPTSPDCTSLLPAYIDYFIGQMDKKPLPHISFHFQDKVFAFWTSGNEIADH